MKTGHKKKILYCIYVVVIGFSCFFQQVRGGHDNVVESMEKLMAQLQKTNKQSKEDLTRLQEQLNTINAAFQKATNDAHDDLQKERNRILTDALKEASDVSKEQIKLVMQNASSAIEAFKDSLANSHQWKTSLDPETLNLVQNIAASMDTLTSQMSKSPLSKGLGRLFSTLSDTVKEPKVMMGAVALVGFSMMAVKFASYGVDKLQTILDKPSIVLETNIRTIMDTVLKRPLPMPASQKDLVYNPELQKDLNMILSMTKKARVLNEEYSHFMLFGPPGTGKTAFAKVLAQQSGMKYAIISGEAFATLHQDQAILEFKRLFKWAEASKQPLMIIIDEAELALTSREDATCSELQRNLVSTFLTHVPKPSSKSFLIVLLSNLPHRLDSAVRDRMGAKIEIPLPGLRERRIMFDKYLKKEIIARRTQTLDPKIGADIAQEDSALAKMMQGLSGRAIEESVKEMRKEARFEGSKVLTYDIAARVIQKKIDEERKTAERYDVQKIKQDALKMNTTPVSSTHMSTATPKTE